MDQSAIGVSLAGVSIPSFWLSIMLIFIFSVKLHWFPVQGYVSIEESGIGVIKYLVNSEDSTKRAEGRNFMIYGIIAIFVMISFWGFVGVLQGTFDLGNNVLIPQVQGI